MLQLWFIANTILWPFGIDLGGLNLQVNVVLLILAGTYFLWKRRKIAFSTVRVLLFLFAYISLSFLAAIAGPCGDKFQKSMITVPILMILSLIGLEAGRVATTRDWLGLQKMATAALIITFSGFLVEMLRPAWFPFSARYRSAGLLSGLFHEPSEVAFSLFPCIAVLLVAENKALRRRGIVALGGLLLFSRSSTLIALIAAWILYRLLVQRKLRQAGLLAVGFVGIVGLTSAVNYTLVAPTIDRIAGVVLSDGTDNISSLVYVQGWEDAWANFTRTRGVGLGFNMMGCHPLPDVPARAVLAIGGLGELNAENGSFQFAKIVSEAGVAGIAFYVAIIWWWIRLERKIRELRDNPERCVNTIQAALMFCFISSSFIRGGSYFGGELLLWLVAASGASTWRRRLLAKQSVPKTAGHESASGAAECA